MVILGKPATITALYHATAKIVPKMEELAKLPTLAAKRSARHPHVNREKKFKNMMDAGYAKVMSVRLVMPRCFELIVVIISNIPSTSYTSTTPSST